MKQTEFLASVHGLFAEIEAWACGPSLSIVWLAAWKTNVKKCKVSTLTV